MMHGQKNIKFCNYCSLIAGRAQ